MKQKNKRHILFRYMLIIVGILVFAGLIVYKMFQTTVIDADVWNTKAQEILSREEVVIPERGNIYASNNNILATNLFYYTARVDWATQGINRKFFMDNLDALSDSMHAFAPKYSAGQWRDKLLKEMNAKKKNRSYRIASNITYLDYQRLRTFPFFNTPKNKNGLYYETATKRTKPYGSMASRSIGRVGEVNGAQHGTSGLEKALDSLLFGTPGTARKIQLTNNITNWETIPAKRGYDIKTTIDIDIQDIAEEELYNMCVESSARWGTVVVMEVHTGEIKAISNLEWNDSFKDYVEGRNNAVLGYEPGSVMKPISMLLALENGVVNNIDSVIATGHSFAYAGGRPISDGHGAASMPIKEIIERSSNVGMAKVILRRYERHPGMFYSDLKKLGFFDPIHSGIAGEEIPQIDSLGDKNWDRIALSRMAFGYATLIPPLSTLAVYNAIANDGKYVRPRLVKELMINGVTDSVLPISYIRPQICSPRNAQKLRQMLNLVVWGEHGTAKVLKDEKVNISGKTGTCFTNEKGQYSAQKRLAFCGFFPYEKPKYSCVVLMLGANRGAARSSGMVLKNIALKLYSRGMLDNQSDFRADTQDKKGEQGIMYATSDKSKMEKLRNDLKLHRLKYFKTQPQPKTGAPSVIGMGIKEAINTVEKAGLNVEFRGAGYVVGQSIPAGSQFKKGDVITLLLKH